MLQLLQLHIRRPAALSLDCLSLICVTTCIHDINAISCVCCLSVFLPLLHTWGVGYGNWTE